MASKSKLQKFAELASNPIVLEKNPAFKGKWNTDFFKNQHPIVLELACGKGDYTLGMARLFPEKNFIGADIKGNRIWSAARIAGIENLQNVGFIRDQIDHINDYFEPGEVEEIWITFSDPFPRDGDAKRRLTSAKFLPHYKEILKAGGLIHLKTDSDLLYSFTKETLNEFPSEILKDYEDVYAMNKNEELYGIQTYYEKMHLLDKRTIKYLCFRLL
ncbi:MAG TPA: tRNA (guanosine(46)-N7)-methyltransferase TrmB [Chitinophagales bacterium]|nr:tRNA (guanosine(46)-N7)-methyltransferase TrmB [Chitinophagales bacterium]